MQFGGVHFNKVTWYSRMLSYVFVFGIFPIIVFFIAGRYYETVQLLTNAQASTADIYLNAAYDAKSLQAAGAYNARQNIQGIWVSDDDKRYEMTIKPNNVFYERYDGKIERSGSWIIQDSLRETKFADQPSGLYLQKNTMSSGGIEEILYYRITALNDQSLSLLRLDKGDSLTFKRKSE